jgi:hypothetical protein
MSGKTLNAEGIMKLLNCDVVYDWNEQLRIRDALCANLNVLVLSLERNPYRFKGRGCVHIFDGAVKTPIEIIRIIMADDWLTEPKRDVKSMVVQYVSLLHQGGTFVKAIHNGKDIMEFQSEDEAEAWIADHPFVSDPHDVIEKISYQVRRFEHARKPTKYQP